MEIGKVQSIVFSVIAEPHFLELDAVLGTDIRPQSAVEGQAGIFVLADESSDEGRIDIHHRQVQDGRKLHDVERRTAFLLQLAVKSRNLLLEAGHLLLEGLALSLRALEVLATVLDEGLPYKERKEGCEKQYQPDPKRLAVEDQPQDDQKHEDRSRYDEIFL